MYLTLEKIRERLTKPLHKNEIDIAVNHQDRLRLHCDVKTESKDCYANKSLNQFLAFVKNILTEDKYRLFLTLLRYPIVTNDVTDIIFDKLARIFDGRNPSFDYRFTDAELLADWQAYRTNVLKEPAVWQTLGWSNFKTEINSVLIVDVAQSQNADKPEPYFYWLPIGNVIDFSTDNEGNIEDIIFNDNDKIVAIDNVSYKVYRKAEGDAIRLEVENPHDLGYCPARFFWNVPLSLSTPNVKKSPLTKELEKLDWYLFFLISKRHLDMYGSYPIYSGYEANCDYTDEINHTHCEHGFLKNEQDQYVFDSAGVLMQCPKCGKHKINGAGSFIEIPIPSAPNAEGYAYTPDLKNPVQMLSVDRNSLDYNAEECDRLKNEIITACIGTDTNVLADNAVNEMQVEATFESQSSILNRIKEGFEQAQQFIDETICRLRYGNQFISATINYGTDFFILTPAELRERYKTAKDAGASESELDSLQSQIIETEYRNDAQRQQRMKLLAEIEPYRHLSIAEMRELLNNGIIGREDMVVKVNFSNYIKRFERENGDINAYVMNGDYADRIEQIEATLKSYVSPINNQTL